MSFIGWMGKAVSNRFAPIRPWVRFGGEVEVEDGDDGAPKAVIHRGPLANAHAALMGGVERLSDLSRAGRIDLRKIETLHEDGGVAAFDAARRSASVDETGISAIAENFRFFGKIKAVIGSLIFIAGVAVLAFFGDFYSFGALLAFAAVFSTASAMDHYRAWQFDQRRFGSLAEWVNARRGRAWEEGKK